MDSRPKWVNIADLREANGKTIRENRSALVHQVPIGSLVQLSSGVRLFVARHDRDCDGTPLYALCVKMEDAADRSRTHNGYDDAAFTQWWTPDGLRI